MAPRIYCKDLTLKFGPASTRGLIQGVRATDTEGKFKLCTPDLRAVRQVYIDDDENIYFKDELDRASVDGEGNLIPASADDIAAAKASRLSLNVLELTAHDSADVDQHIFPDKSQAYIFTPGWKEDKTKQVIQNNPANMRWYDFINVIVRDPSLALIGKCNLQNHEGIFRLGIHQGNLFLQKQLYPELLNRYDPTEIRINDEITAEARKVARKLIQDFEPTAYENEISRRLEMVKTGDFTAQDVPVEDDFDLLAALKEFA